MEIRAFAEAVLYSSDLSLKLGSVAGLTDDRPGAAVDIPSAPGRPVDLELRADKPVPAAPTPAGIEDERARGLALHSFAHHELQALELMALALLRFPDAPRGFRRGLAKILMDEQRHFRMYMDRAEHWGVGLGEVGTGTFFWDTVSELSSPVDFLAALSLTYEQANLDFSSYWEDAFRAVDDEESARVLHEVYEDEITHVRHGVAWFGRLAGEVSVESHARRLLFPLSPGRAKGPTFDRQGRVRAGLSQTYIDELEITNVSRGRPPRIFSFDPFLEERAAGRTPKAAVQFVADDLASVLMFLAHREDVVIAERPSLEVLLPLHRLGVDVPQFVPSEDALEGRVLGKAAPWGRVDQVGAVTKCDAHALRCALVAEHPSPLWVEDLGVVCHSLDDVPSGTNLIAKAPLSASGQHRVLLDQPGASRWLTKQLKVGPVLVEPWWERLVDLSVQLELTDDGARNLGVTRFWTSASGSYRGCILGPWSAGLQPELLRALHGGGRGSQVNDALSAMARVVGDALWGRGIRGPVGIDCMVVSSDGTPRLVPILEVNPRTTMGRVSLGIHRSTGLRGGWFHLDDDALRDGGFRDRSAFIQRVRETDGIYFTTDPERAKRVMTVASVDKNIDAAREAWNRLGLEWPS